MDGFVADCIGAFAAEIGKQPNYEQYAQIMDGLPNRADAGSVDALSWSVVRVMAATAAGSLT